VIFWSTKIAAQASVHPAVFTRHIALLQYIISAFWWYPVLAIEQWPSHSTPWGCVKIMEAESFRFAAYGSYVNTYAPAGLRVSGSFISSGSTKMSQERWFQEFLVFTSNWGRFTYFMSNLAYLSMLKPPKREEPKTSKGPSRTRRESAVSRLRALGGGVFPLNLSLSKWRSVQGDWRWMMIPWLYQITSFLKYLKCFHPQVFIFQGFSWIFMVSGLKWKISLEMLVKRGSTKGGSSWSYTNMTWKDDLQKGAETLYTVTSSNPMRKSIWSSKHIEFSACQPTPILFLQLSSWRPPMRNWPSLDISPVFLAFTVSCVGLEFLFWASIRESTCLNCHLWTRKG